MAADRNVGWRPDWAVHPGEILAETLSDREMTQVELGRRTGRPLKAINEIVKGKTSITADTALQLESALGVPARFWLNLQRDFDEAKAREKLRERLSEHGLWAKQFPLAAMANRRLVPRSRSTVEQVESLLSFFGVSSPDLWRDQWQQPAAVFRRSLTGPSSLEALTAWLRWGQVLAAGANSVVFDRNQLEASIAPIRALTLLHPIAFRRRLRDLLAGAGVVVLYLPELPGTRVMGATQWDRARPIVQLSLRHKTDDQFWFAVFHELAHVLNGDRRQTYVDPLGAPETDEHESAANAFARATLVPGDRYREFVATKDFSSAAIRAFASQIGTMPGIVVGRLQHDRLLGYGPAEHLKQKIDWLKVT